MIEGYFEFSIACYLQLLKPLDTFNGEKVSTVIGYSGMILVLVLPIAIIILLLQNIDTLKQDSYINRWGAVYEGLKFHNKFELSFYLWFLLRRLIFIYSVFYLNESSII